MYKSQHGFGIFEVLLAVAAMGLFGTFGWMTYERQKTPTHNDEARSATERQKPDDQPNNSPTIPNPPADLKVTASEKGYMLTWKASTSPIRVVRYQVFYQGNRIAEPTSTSYHHELPSPPPGCEPIPLTYYIQAVDVASGVSEPSERVTVKFGGC